MQLAIAMKNLFATFSLSVAILAPGTGFMPAEAAPALLRSGSELGDEIKSLVGYQGWFRCPGDGSKANAWRHWLTEKDGQQRLSVDLLPNMDKLPGAFRCQLPLSMTGGAQIWVYSSYSSALVEDQVKQIHNYRIDGILVQRFTSYDKSFVDDNNHVLDLIRRYAEKYGVHFAVEYDITGHADDGGISLLMADWLDLNSLLSITP